MLALTVASGTISRPNLLPIGNTSSVISGRLLKVVAGVMIRATLL